MTDKRFAVIGDPIDKSLSPKIHNLAYEALGLDWNYEAVQVPAGSLGNFMESASSFSGFSVTMPLKFEAAKFSRPSDQASISTGVVNTLVRTENGFLGFNTDVFGIIRALGSIETPKTIAILGSGATATSAIFACKLAFSEAKISLFARNLQRSSLLAERFELNSGPLEDLTRNFDLLINTIPESNFDCEGLILNTGYTFEETLPANVISGKEMLLWQAVAQIRIFLSGNAELVLPSEEIVLERMRLALSNA